MSRNCWLPWGHGGQVEMLVVETIANPARLFRSKKPIKAILQFRVSRKVVRKVIGQRRPVSL